MIIVLWQIIGQTIGDWESHLYMLQMDKLLKYLKIIKLYV